MLVFIRLSVNDTAWVAASEAGSPASVKNLIQKEVSEPGAINIGQLVFAPLKKKRIFLFHLCKEYL